MLATEWNMDEALRIRWEEGREDGIEEGMEKGMEKGRKLFSGLMKQARSMDELAQMFEATFTRQS